MKILRATIALVVLVPFIAMAANQYSQDFESDSAQILSINDAAQTGLDLSGDFTIEAWIKPESLESNKPMDIVSKDGADNRGYAFSLAGTPGVLQVIFLDANGNASQFETDQVISTPGVWHHVAVAVDVSIPSAEFFLDGVQVPVTLVAYNAATSINNNAASFRIGTRETDSFYFDGLVDEVRVWKTQRTKNQIKKSMHGKLIGNLNKLVGEWTFDGQSYADTSSNGNDLVSETAGPALEFSTDIP